MKMRHASVAVVLLSLLTQTACFTTVSDREHCLLLSYGKIKQEKMGTGLKFTPFTNAECFPLTDNTFGPVDFTAMAKDSILVTGKFTYVWAHNPTEVVALYRAKGSAEMAVQEIEQGAMTGLQNAIAQFRSDDLNTKPEQLDAALKASIDRVQQGRALSKRTFARSILPPQAILAARQAAQTADLNLIAAVKSNAADSVKARSTVFAAQAAAEAKKLEAQSYASNPVIVDMEVRKAAASALANVCAKATTCILGASTLEQFLAGRR